MFCSKWKTGNENISSLLILPDYTRLITASRNIKLWNVETKEMLRVFTGHSSQVHILRYVKPEGSDTYFISGAKVSFNTITYLTIISLLIEDKKNIANVWIIIGRQIVKLLEHQRRKE